MLTRKCLLALFTTLVITFLLVLVPPLQFANAQPGASTPPQEPTPDYGPYPDYGPPSQPYYGPPQPQPMQPATPRRRHGWHAGLSLGIGTLESTRGEFRCTGCEASVSLAFDLHVGFMLLPTLALQIELWGQQRSLDSQDKHLATQGFFLIAAQYWIVNRFWIKAGIGSADFSSTYLGDSQHISSGGSGMAAVGYEFARGTSYAVDLQLKTGVGIYENGNTEISTTTIGLGLNWY